MEDKINKRLLILAIIIYILAWIAFADDPNELLFTDPNLQEWAFDPNGYYCVIHNTETDQWFTAEHPDGATAFEVYNDSYPVEFRQKFPSLESGWYNTWPIKNYVLMFDIYKQFTAHEYIYLIVVKNWMHCEPMLQGVCHEIGDLNGDGLTNFKDLEIYNFVKEYTKLPDICKNVLEVYYGDPNYTVCQAQVVIQAFQNE